MNRRTFFKTTGALGLSAGLPLSAHEAITPGFPNYNPKIKRVIHLCMAGGISQFESFENKPLLKEMDGKEIPASMTKGKQLAQLQGQKLKAFGGRFEFNKHGKSGLEISDKFPNIAKHADKLCIINSMHTDQINHDPAHTVFNTGTILPGRPSMGSWINYAVGSETNDLPGYVVLVSSGGGQGQPLSSRQWSNGFLPGKTQGVQFNSKGDAVHYVNSPKGVSLDHQSRIIANIAKLNQHLRTKRNDPAIETRIAQYELALKMQTSVPKLTDFSKESKATIDMYGCKPGDGSYASNCLMARKLAENGVRFIQLYHRGWDHHNNINGAFPNAAKLTDQATAALISDLDQRGMLEDTLIIFGGEFGRTPMAQGTGRDHHMSAFSHVVLGGGIKGGITYGKTDEFGYEVVEKPVHVRDMHATILHLLGIDHHRLSVKFQGLDSKLTGVHKAKVIKEILT
ncbi:DUF1501 domain-containing protein [Lentisphaera profundi]|uniref:DUF1501 domain-containing protein n=1 Tax=Lentisphaera profundi TaxID=1658616 RepID=A0ABY7VNT7_9BACT|nr:DUF1501 domain-containing protein [Lentisphaera profundi]WDE95344.1 DUF1501 domain-containing protein [Lentisphaera profundi]